jgi:hypothetical protein
VIQIERALTWSTAAGSVAKGVLFSVGALFFTAVVGLSPAVVGVGLTVAGIFGMAAAFAAGSLSDRYGARRVLLAATLGQGAALAAYCFTRHPVAFVLVASVAAAGQGAQRTAQVTMLARAFEGAGRIGARARLRVVSNIFVAVGSAAAAGALGLGTRAAYVTAMLAAAALMLFSAVPLLSLPDVAGAPTGTVPPALHDRRYLALAAFGGIITIQFGVLTVGMPLWVTGHTRAPAATVALLLLLNTALVTVCQVRLTRTIVGVPSAGRAVVRAVLLLVAACLLYAAAAHGGAAVAVGVLVVAVVAHSLGEMLSEAGGWELAFELADPRNPGAYQGISQTGFAIGTALAPAAVTSTAITHGTPGWLLLGAVFLAAGAGTAVLTTATTRDAAARA